MQNENGNTTISFLLILCLIFTLSLSTVYKKIKQINKGKEIAKAFLCTKEYTGLYKDHVKKISKLNRLILILNSTKKISLFIPGIGPITSHNAHQAERTLILLQNGQHVSYLKKMYELYKSSCSFSPQVFKTAFEHRGYQLKRGPFNQAKIRKSPWQVYYLSFYQRLKIIHHRRKSSVEELL